MDHWSESYQNTSRHCAERGGNNIRDDAMAEQIRLSLVLFASFGFIIEHLLGNRGKTDHSALSLFLQTWRLVLVILTLLNSAKDMGM